MARKKYQKQSFEHVGKIYFTSKTGHKDWPDFDLISKINGAPNNRLKAEKLKLDQPRVVVVCAGNASRYRFERVFIHNPTEICEFLYSDDAGVIHNFLKKHDGDYN